jgi:hypothetical protein
MPQLGLGLRANVSGVSLIDVDAAAYFTRAGVTDATAKAQINEFVKGVKALGLYNNMVCWPLRSDQNASSGTTQYSLGGYGIYNGTLVGSPTRGANGIAFDGSKIMTTSGLLHNPSTTNSSLVAVVSSSEILSTVVIVEMNNGASAGVRIRRDTPIRYGISAINSGNTQDITSVSNSATLNVFAFLAGSFSTTQQFAVADGVQSPIATNTLGNANTISFQLGLAAANFTGTNAFASYFASTALTLAQTESLRSLYKTTLGTGLGLP